MKKVIVLLLALVFAISLITCTKATTTTEPKTEEATKLTEAIAPAETGWTPEHAVTILVPWSAGGGSDLAVRTLVPYLEKELGVNMTVVNSTGANGWVAWAELLRSKADGYTIAQMNIPTVYSGYMDPQQKRDVDLDDFMFVANEISDWGCLVVKKGDKRFPDAKAFVEYAISKGVLAGDNGVGTNKHLCAESFMKAVPGAQITEVHQAGWADTYASILGGHVDCGWGSIGETRTAYQDGELDILCVFATSRSSLLPDVPTFGELFPEYGIVTSPSDRGFALPAGCDQAVYDRWVSAMSKCINNPEFIAKMAELGQAVNYVGGADYTQYVVEQESQMAEFAELLGWK